MIKNFSTQQYKIAFLPRLWQYSLALMIIKEAVSLT